ncbi:MAG: hypothetical protein HY049_10970 [Acidobacteria bacterium]|nr:hypothetical protein [Acidobacteriota bacterium]
MFLGHFAVGFAAKRVAPKASLAWLMTAPNLLDLLWPFFLLAGWERVRIEPGNTAFTPLAFDAYPWSHSLLMACIWGLGLAAVYLWLSQRARLDFAADVRGARVIALAVVSHWVLDVVTHRPDMPIAPGIGIKLGFGLWNSVGATIAVEGALFAAGVWVYASSTRARDRTGAWSLIGLVVLLVAIYAGLIFGPPPPGVAAVAWSDLAGWLLVPWAAWIDRHRDTV